MSRFHSRQSVNDGDAGLARERKYYVPLADWDVEPDFYTNPISALAPEQSKQTSGKLVTEPLTSISVPLQAMHTTQPFMLTLQSTMNPRTGKMPLVISGSRQKISPAGKLPQPARGLHPSIRLGVVTLATLGILLFTLFSLSPLGGGQNSFSLFDGAIKWTQEQQIAWDGIVNRMEQKGQPAVAGANTTTQPATTNLPAATNLPRGTYVNIARQFAVKYGINPDNFVRQIQQESHFDPNAQSPQGAVGIAQFIPSTAASIGVNPYDPVSALDGAARLMASLSSQFGGDYAKALAAYNAGPGAVQSAVNIGGMAWLAYLPAETQNYVRTIMG